MYKDLKKITNILDSFENKDITITQRGFIETNFYIKNITYDIKMDILKIKDKEKKIYIIINLNQVYRFELLSNGISLYLDNDTQIDISI